ncbi:MAG: alpha/beta fold hydrolase, partial [Alphaproteobacteria bacterium]
MATFPRGKHLTTNDVRLHYLEFGSAGQPLLLLPGITSPAITWAFVSERLAQWLHVYTLDIRGRGLSEQRPGLGYRLNDYALDAKGVIEKL